MGKVITDRFEIIFLNLEQNFIKKTRKTSLITTELQ